MNERVVRLLSYESWVVIVAMRSKAAILRQDKDHRGLYMLRHLLIPKHGQPIKIPMRFMREIFGWKLVRQNRDGSYRLTSAGSGV